MSSRLSNLGFLTPRVGLWFRPSGAMVRIISTHLQATRTNCFRTTLLAPYPNITTLKAQASTRVHNSEVYTHCEIMPPKRKNARPLTTKPPTTASNTIFPYNLKVKPYDVFCQWKPSPITIPTHVLLTICDKPSTPSILAALKVG